MLDPIGVTLEVIRAFESLGVQYVIGGSLAGALNGVVRATLDSDLVANIEAHQVAALVKALGPDFYADAEAIQTALRAGYSFNLIHLETMFKVDVFPCRRPFDEMQLARRTQRVVTIEPEQRAYVQTPEDVMLAKLDWYRQGGEVSDRQWRDILGVLKIQRERLDLRYLREWAHHLQVSDLLERALSSV